MMRSRLAPAALALLLLGTIAHADAAKEVQKTLPLDANGSLTIKTYKGSITVTTGQGAEVRIQARVEPDGDDADQRRKVEETRIEITGDKRAVTVESDYREIKRHHHGWFGGWFGDNEGTLPFVHYTITMPRTAKLEIDDYKSEIKVRDLAGDLRLETYKGKAVLDGLDGGARIETYKGDVRVDFTRMASDVHLTTYKGSFEVRLPKESRFDLDADTGRRGDIDSDFAVNTEARSRWRRESERVTSSVNGGGPRFHFDTYKGSLRLHAK